jgi:Rad3-related DNA helicase/REP element-mobilizing transposase RayT
MPTHLTDILGPDGAIARRLADKYEHRPQQLEMAAAVESAFTDGHHLLVEAGTGVGKSFAYLIPAIHFAVTHKKRVVISTHTISLQEQLIDKDIPLLRSLMPDEFTAVLVKGRSNYLCQRRLQQTRTRQGYFFDYQKQLDSLWMVEEWAAQTTEGSLTDLPSLPEPEVWDKVCAEHGNCLGKKCDFYDKCFWQAAKRRMQSGNILVVNHALLFSDLALRMAGVNYLPKYDLLILDEAHTIEDVAGDHFGLKISEGGLKYELRVLYDTRKGRGILSTYGSAANNAIQVIVDLQDRIEHFFDRALRFQQSTGRSNGRIQQPNWIENDLSPKLRDLSKHIKSMLATIKDEAEQSELSSHANKVATLAEALDSILAHKLDDAVYWIESTQRTPRRVSLHAAPIDVAQGLQKYLFEKIPSIILTSATLCASGTSPKLETRKHGQDARPTVTPPRSTGILPVSPTFEHQQLHIRQGAHLPHWTQRSSVYAITFRLADSLPSHIVEGWKSDRQAIISNAKQQNRPLTSEEAKQLKHLFSHKVEKFLDSSSGSCVLRRDDIAEIVSAALKKFDHQRYRLAAWSIMPNHVHVVVQPLDEWTLPKILHSWKSFTAVAINRLLNTVGTLWQTEYYDHLIRDEEDLVDSIQYAFENPDHAGLEDWPWRFQDDAFNSSIASPSSERTEDGQDARATTNAPRSTGILPVSQTLGSADPRFAYIKSRLGVIREKTLALGSPFDYETQSTLYLETDLPDPTDTMRFFPAACERILHYIRQTNGGAFVLFTSYKMLKDAAARLRPALEELGHPVLVHGEGAPRKILLERFRAADNAVLFGTASFWQGIDVQGDALRNVIITKLPFAVPDEPVTEARLEMITRRGGNPFMEYSVPEAVIKLKQGFGRLIRAKTDTGIVAILDPRIVTKRYGKTFLDALPPCRRVIVSAKGEQPA